MAFLCFLSPEMLLSLGMHVRAKHGHAPTHHMLLPFVKKAQVWKAEQSHGVLWMSKE